VVDEDDKWRSFAGTVGVGVAAATTGTKDGAPEEVQVAPATGNAGVFVRSTDEAGIGTAGLWMAKLAGGIVESSKAGTVDDILESVPPKSVELAVGSALALTPAASEQAASFLSDASGVWTESTGVVATIGTIEWTFNVGTGDVDKAVGLSTLSVELAAGSPASLCAVLFVSRDFATVWRAAAPASEAGCTTEESFRFLFFSDRQSRASFMSSPLESAEAGAAPTLLSTLVGRRSKSKRNGRVCAKFKKSSRDIIWTLSESAQHMISPGKRSASAAAAREPGSISKIMATVGESTRRMPKEPEREKVTE
jgi:hypothetical protein